MGQRGGDRESRRGQALRRGEQPGQRQRPEALVQRQQSVHAPGYRDAPHIVLERHPAGTLIAQLRGVGARTRAPGGVERRRWHSRAGDHGEHVAAQPAHVRRDDRHNGRRSDRRIGGVAITIQCRQARCRSEMAGGRDRCIGGVACDHVAKCNPFGSEQPPLAFHNRG
jgi:hypothetical protein